jgi:hypothetical protein
MIGLHKLKAGWESLYPTDCWHASPRHRTEAEEGDELAGELASCRRRIDAERYRLGLLLAYAREFKGRRPYPLAYLADAAGMTPSGVRTAYRPSDVEDVAVLLELADLPDT